VRILYDYQVFSIQRYGGASRYFVELARRIGSSSNCDVDVLALAHINAYVDTLPRQLVTGRRMNSRLGRHPRFTRVFNGIVTSAITRLASPDIVHETYYSRHRHHPRTVPSVVTVYDMIHERFAHYFPNSADVWERKAAAIGRAAHVICISESTRQNLLERVPLDESSVSVIHLASSIAEHAVTDEPRAERDEEPFLLFVGQRGAYKNFAGFLKALSMLPSHLRSIRVVMFGGGALTDSEHSDIAAHGLSSQRMVQVDGDDALLATYYARAHALVYPSLYEGFGLPPLEAMTCGCPVVCGRSGSLSEVVGEAAELVDPMDPESIAVGLTRVLDSPALADDLRRRGRVRASLFSWDRCATETLGVYERVRQS
jgi:glycosyltransferase involved in cell wall biosynthesis